jgi:hypothetical protein
MAVSLRVPVALAICCSVAVLASSSALRFVDVEGDYVSTMHGGCELSLRGDSTFVLTCQTLPACQGRAVPFDDSFGLVCGLRNEVSTVLQHQNPPASPGWPPATRDPTQGPYVPSGPTQGPQDPQPHPRIREFFWLAPLHWGDRLYLIRDADYDAFCLSIRVGIEPRKLAAGEQFLRRGDHLKAAPNEPNECRRGKTRAAEQGDEADER